MIYKKIRKSVFINTACVLSCTCMIANASQLHYQPLTSPLAAKSGTRSVTDDLLVRLPVNNFDAITIEWLNNTHLVYTLPMVNSTQVKKIERIDVKTGQHILLGEGENPKPSPDGQWIVFTKGEGKERQLWLMRSNGTETKQLTHAKNGLGTYKYNFDLAWSSNSKHIALSYSLSSPHSFRSAIDVMDISGAKTRRIFSTDEFQLRSISWSPDGKELLFWKEQAEGLSNKKNDLECIQSVRVSDRHLRTLAQFEGLQQDLSPAFSPDGKQIAIMYDPDHPYFDTTQNIGLISAASTDNNSLPSIKRLTYELKLSSPQWSRDGQSIYAIRVYGAYPQIYNINVKTGEQKQITHAPFSIGWNGYTLSPDGKQLAWTAFNAHATRVIRVASSNGQHVRDLVTLPGVPANMALSEVREIEWDTINYPSRMRGLLMLPLNYQTGIRYPLVVDIHGGGSSARLHLAGGILVSTPLEWQMWTAKGYAVFVPEFRSSGAFGSLADTRDNYQEHDIINRDIVDIETGVDALIASGIVDSNRLAIVGHSAGGRRANWLTVTRHTFRAVVSNDGWADELIDTLKNPLKRVHRLYGGTPEQVPQNYLKNSALLHANGASTPTLFLMANPKLGGADPNDTVRLLYNAIRAKGIESQYVYYPDEGHVFVKPGNRLDALRRSIKWIDDHTTNP